MKLLYRLFASLIVLMAVITLSSCGKRTTLIDYTDKIIIYNVEENTKEIVEDKYIIDQYVNDLKKTECLTVNWEKAAPGTPIGKTIKYMRGEEIIIFVEKQSGEDMIIIHFNGIMYDGKNEYLAKKCTE